MGEASFAPEIEPDAVEIKAVPTHVGAAFYFVGREKTSWPQLGEQGSTRRSGLTRRSRNCTMKVLSSKQTMALKPLQCIGVYPRCQPMVQLAHRSGAQPGCSKTSAGGRGEGCNGGKPLSLNNIARLKNRVTMRAFQAGWAGNISFSRRRRPTECE